MSVENINCTIVTCLYNIGRETWHYKREWQKYLEYFENTLSLRSKFVIFVDPSMEDFVSSIRKKYDPGLNFTKIVKKEFKDFPKYYLHERISGVLSSPEYRNGLVDPHPPEYNIPEYIILIHSKMFLVEEAIDKNFYNTDYYMWLDGGIRHSSFRSEDRLKLYPNPTKIKEIKGIRMLCRVHPQESDLDIKTFYKSHKNRFGAGVILGSKEKIKEFNSKMSEILEEALSMNLIDSEQSMHSICYLRNKEMFDLIYNDDWYYHFDFYL